MPIDPDLKKQLDEVNFHLSLIKKQTNASIWRSFLTGTLSGLGSVVGVAIALLVIGWILNTIGVIPAFRAQVNKMQSTLDKLENSR